MIQQKGLLWPVLVQLPKEGKIYEAVDNFYLSQDWVLQDLPADGWSTGKAIPAEERGKIAAERIRQSFNVSQKVELPADAPVALIVLIESEKGEFGQPIKLLEKAGVNISLNDLKIAKHYPYNGENVWFLADGKNVLIVEGIRKEDWDYAQKGDFERMKIESTFSGELGIFLDVLKAEIAREERGEPIGSGWGVYLEFSASYGERGTRGKGADGKIYDAYEILRSYGVPAEVDLANKDGTFYGRNVYKSFYEWKGYPLVVHRQEK